MELQGLKVSVSKDGKRSATQSGKLLIEGNRLLLKKLIRKKELFDLQAVQALEHKGRKLVVRLPLNFFVIDFKKPAKEALAYKEAFSRLVGVPLPAPVKSFEFTKTHLVAVLLFGVISLIVAVVHDGPRRSSGSKPKQSASSPANPAQKQPTEATKPGPAVPNSKTLVQEPAVPPVPQPSYEVVGEEVFDAPSKTQVELKVVVAGEIAKEGVSALLAKLYSETMSRTGFKHHLRPTSAYIYAYTDKEAAESGPEWIGMLSKCHSCDSPNTVLADHRFEHLGAAPQERFGLSEEKRKEVYRKSVLVEDRAGAEARARHPVDPTQAMVPGDRFTLTKRTPLVPRLDVGPMVGMRELIQLEPGTSIRVKELKKEGSFTKYYRVEARPKRGRKVTGWIDLTALMWQSPVDGKAQMEKQAELMNKLQERYDRELAEEYGLTRDHLTQIAVEAWEKGWPMPEAEE